LIDTHIQNMLQHDEPPAFSVTMTSLVSVLLLLLSSPFFTVGVGLGFSFLGVTTFFGFEAAARLILPPFFSSWGSAQTWNPI